MINLSNKIIFTRPEDELKDLILTTLSNIYAQENEYCREFQGSDSKRWYQERLFSEKCDPDKLRKDQSTIELVNSMYTALTCKQKDTAKHIRNVLGYFSSNPPQVNYFPSLRRPFARILVELWDSECLLLPLWFPFLHYYDSFSN